VTARSKRRDWSHARAILVGALLFAAGFGAPVRSQSPAHVSNARAVTATATGGNVKVSGWATFSGVNVASGTSKPGSAGPNGDQLGTDLTDAAIWYRPELTDLFIRWKVNKLPSTSAGVNIVGAPGVLYGLSTTIANTPIEIRVQSFGVSQRFALFKCSGESTCLLAGSLSGGFGTIDDEVVVSVPLATLAGFGLALKEGEQIGTPVAWTAFPASMDAPAPTPSQAMVDVIATAKSPRITIPAKSVTVSVGTYSTKAALNEGNFTADLPRRTFPKNPAVVTTKTCVGSACTKQSFSIRI
jgi:hypothetical protein